MEQQNESQDKYEKRISEMSDVDLIIETACLVGDTENEDKLDACKAECEERDADNKYFRNGGRFNKAYRRAMGFAS